MVQMACIGPLNTHESGEGCILKSPYYQNSLILERNPPERKFLYMLKIFSQEDFALKYAIDIDRKGFRTPFLVFFSSRNKGQLWPDVTWP